MRRLRLHVSGYTPTPPAHPSGHTTLEELRLMIVEEKSCSCQQVFYVFPHQSDDGQRKVSVRGLLKDASFSFYLITELSGIKEAITLRPLIHFSFYMNNITVFI